MTDERRKAAEDYLLRLYGDRDRLQLEVFREFVERDHVAGQECGEQRAVEGIVRWLRDEAGKIVDIDEHVTYHLLADAIERGEWKEEK